MPNTPVIRWHQVVLLALIAAGGYGLYHAGSLAWQRIQALQWTPRMPELPPEPAALAPAPDVAALSATRERPLFWPSRRPPPPPKPAVPVAEPPRLLGVATTADGRSVALLAMGAAPQRTRRLAVGQGWDGYTVRAITPQGVELEGPGGVSTLQMPRRVQP